MKISYISPYPPIRSGIGTYTSYLCKALLKINKEVEISVIAEKGTSKIKEKRFETFPCFNSKEEYVKKISKSLLRFSPDIVHIQHEFSIFNPNERLLNLLKELKKSTKIVLTLHNVQTNESNDWDVKGMSMEKYNFSMGQLVDAIIVHQVSMKEVLIRQGLNQRLIHVIPHGTEILRKVDKTEAMRKLELPENGRIILSFGFLVGIKIKN